KEGVGRVPDLIEVSRLRLMGDPEECFQSAQQSSRKRERQSCSGGRTPLQGVHWRLAQSGHPAAHSDETGQGRWSRVARPLKSASSDSSPPTFPATRRRFECLLG